MKENQQDGSVGTASLMSIARARLTLAFLNLRPNPQDSLIAFCVGTTIGQYAAAAGGDPSGSVLPAIVALGTQQGVNLLADIIGRHNPPAQTMTSEEVAVAVQQRLTDGDDLPGVQMLLREFGVIETALISWKSSQQECYLQLLEELSRYPRVCSSEVTNGVVTALEPRLQSINGNLETILTQLSNSDSGRVKIELRIDMPIGKFNEVNMMKIIQALAEYSGTDQDSIRPVAVREGSVIITLRVPKKAAKKIIRAYNNQDRTLLGILAPLTILDLAYADETNEVASRDELFWNIFQSQLSAIDRLIRFRFLDGAAHEDIIQDVWEQAYRIWKVGQGLTLHAYEGIILTIARRVISDRLRMAARDSKVEPIDDDLQVLPDENAQSEARALIESLYHKAKLSHEELLVFALRYESNLVVDEIAEVLGVSTGVVRGRLQNAHKKLRAIIDVSKQGTWD